ncbi:hypothetical protein [Amycolatopsis sp. cmx-4-54]
MRRGLAQPAVRRIRPVIDQAAADTGRDPGEIATIYNFRAA